MISPAVDTIASKPSQLRGQDVVALLQDATGPSAQISLFEIDQQRWPWVTGILVEVNSRKMELALNVEQKPSFDMKEKNTLIAKLYYNEHIYQFETQPTACQFTGTTAYLPCPDIIDVCERRRIPRRVLRQQSVVQIKSKSGTTPCTTGDMLNVSSAGLACRLSTDDATAFYADMQVRVTFSLDETATEFQVAGRVVNLSKAGTPGQYIVGIEFDDPADDDTKAKIDCAISAGRSV